MLRYCDTRLILIAKWVFQIPLDQLDQIKISKLLDDVGPPGTLPHMTATTQDNKPGKLRKMRDK